MPRPTRTAIHDELGRKRTLLAAPEQFTMLPPAPGAPSRSVVVLGLGPEPERLPLLLSEWGLDAHDVRYVEAPAFAAAMEGDVAGTGPEATPWSARIPARWRPLPPTTLDATESAALLRESPILIYKSAARLFPTFWGPVLAALRMARLTPPKNAPHGPRPAAQAALLPGSSHDLLQLELADALARAGLSPLTFDHASSESPAAVARILSETRPRLMLSVNFRGLDPHGEAFHLLRRAGCEVVVWLVDNPFHQLSGLQAPFWREALLAVTDASFLEPLARHGATRTLHLPLATWPQVFHPKASATRLPVPAETLGQETVFVGRLAFPNRDSFFSGVLAHLPHMDAAQTRMRRGEATDFHWWMRRLGLETLWPGRDARAPGLGAEECSRLRRLAAVEAATAYGPTRVFGDESWSEYMHTLSCELSPPVDYYGPLAGVYNAAAAVLTASSLLLPAGLSQRHFDVWAAGGLLVTDDSPGLAIFPSELTRPVAYRTPEAIPEILARLHHTSNDTKSLQADWRELILKEHTYAHRVAALLDAAGLA